MSNDPFANATDSLIAPARSAIAIVPHASAALPQAVRALYVGVGGDIVLQAVGSQQDVTFSNVPTGSILPVRVSAVRTAGTTAQQLVGLS